MTIRAKTPHEIALEYELASVRRQRDMLRHELDLQRDRYCGCRTATTKAFAGERVETMHTTKQVTMVKLASLDVVRDDLRDGLRLYATWGAPMADATVGSRGYQYMIPQEQLSSVAFGDGEHYVAALHEQFLQELARDMNRRSTR